MRHRAHIPVLIRILALLALPRSAALAVALVTVGVVTGIGLAAQLEDDPEGVPAALDSAPTATPGTPAPPTPPRATEPTTRLSQEPIREPSRVSRHSRSTATDATTPTAPAESASPALDVPLAGDAPPPRADSSPGSGPDAPETSASTSGVNGRTWTIAVSSDEPAAYECSLDGAGFAPCESTTTYRGLAAGDHSFAARAVDDDGNTDPTPARLSTELEGGAGH